MTYIDQDNIPPAPDPLTKEIMEMQFPYLSGEGHDILKAIDQTYRAAVERYAGGARWVKASKRLPDDKFYSIVRYNKNISGVWEKECGNRLLVEELIDNGWIDVEWLDESESLPAVRLIKVSDRFPPLGAPVYKKEGDDFLYVGRFVEGDTFSFAKETGNFLDCYWVDGSLK